GDHRREVEFSSWPRQGKGVNRLAVLCAREANAVSFPPEVALSLPRRINGIAVDTKPRTRFLQLRFRRRMKPTVSIGPHPDHEISTLRRTVDDVLDDPRRTLMLGRIALIGE